MAESNNNTNKQENHHTLQALGGAALFILGVAALNATVITSFAVIYTLGWILTIGGLVGFVLSFAIHSTSGILLGLISAVLSLVVGVLMLLNPTASLATLSLLLAMYFLVDGIIRIVVSFTPAVDNPWVSVIYGVAMLLLGFAVWTRLPTSSLYIFGVFIGIGLVIKGVAILATSVTPVHVGHKPRLA